MLTQMMREQRARATRRSELAAASLKWEKRWGVKKRSAGAPALPHDHHRQPPPSPSAQPPERERQEMGKTARGPVPAGGAGRRRASGATGLMRPVIKPALRSGSGQTARSTGLRMEPSKGQLGVNEQERGRNRGERRPGGDSAQPGLEKLDLGAFPHGPGAPISRIPSSLR